MTVASPLRGPKSPEGGGFAATHLPRAAQATGPPLRPQGCCASRCARQPCGLPLTPETTAAPGTRKSGRPRPAPRCARRATPAVAWHPDTRKTAELAFDSQKERKITNLGRCQGSTEADPSRIKWSQTPRRAPEGRDLYDRRVVSISAGPGLSLVPTRPDHLQTDRLRSCRSPALAPGDHQWGVQRSYRPTNLNKQVVVVVVVPAGPGLSLVPTRQDRLPTLQPQSCRCPALAPRGHQCGVRHSFRFTNLNQQVTPGRLWRMVVSSLGQCYAACNLPVSRLASLSMLGLPRPDDRANTAKWSSFDPY